MLMLKAVGLAALFVAVTGIEIPADLQDFIDELHITCIKKAGITEDDHKNFKLEDKDPKMMCYMKCLGLESKWMAPDGTIQYDFITKTAHPKVAHILVPAIDKCRNIEDGADMCEKAYNFNKCLFEVEKDHWFLP